MERVAELFLEVGPRLRAYLRRLGGTSEEIEEAVSATFEVLVVAVAEGDAPHTNAAGYLYTVAKRSLYAIWSARVTMGNVEQLEEEVAREDPDQLVHDLELSLTAKAFLALEEDEQRLLWAVVAEGKTQAALSAEYGVPPATLRKRVSRATHQFKERYLAAFSAGSVPAGCEATFPLLSRRAFGSLSARQERLLDEHLLRCELCQHLLAELRDEARTIRRLPAAITGIGVAGISGNLLAQSLRGGDPAAARAVRTWRFLLTAGGVAALVALLVAILPSYGTEGIVLSEPVTTEETLSADPDASGGEPASPRPEPAPGRPGAPGVTGDPRRPGLPGSSGTGAARDSTPLGLGVAPSRLELGMPAPGRQITWQVMMRNTSATKTLELGVALAGAQAPSAESPRVSLWDGDTELFRDRDLRDLDERSVSVLGLAPGAERPLTVRVVRDPEDADQSLEGRVEIRVTGAEGTGTADADADATEARDATDAGAVGDAVDADGAPRWGAHLDGDDSGLRGLLGADRGPVLAATGGAAIGLFAAGAACLAAAGILRAGSSRRDPARRLAGPRAGRC